MPTPVSGSYTLTTPCIRSGLLDLARLDARRADPGIRLVFEPCLTRIRWMLGSQRLGHRLCEKLTMLPVPRAPWRTLHNGTTKGTDLLRPGAKCSTVARCRPVRVSAGAGLRSTAHGGTIPCLSHHRSHPTREGIGPAISRRFHEVGDRLGGGPAAPCPPPLPRPDHQLFGPRRRAAAATEVTVRRGTIEKVDSAARGQPHHDGRGRVRRHQPHAGGRGSTRTSSWSRVPRSPCRARSSWFRGHPQMKSPDVEMLDRPGERW